MAVSPSSRGPSKKQKNVTPEIYFARNLAASDKKVRDRTIKKLSKWLSARSSVENGLLEDELLKLWKGLFYCMWMSDKPLIQEELAETIANLVHVFQERSLGLLFFKVALVTLAREWHGIDKWRVDKFLMFVRRLIRQGMLYVANGGWDADETKELAQTFSQQIINANRSIVEQQVPLGLQLHVIDLFLEELAKVSGSKLESSVILDLVKPFIECLARTSDGRVKDSIRKRIFYHLMRQSDVGIAYEHSKNQPQSDSEEDEEAEEAEEEEEEDNQGDEDVDDQADGSDPEEESNGEKDPRAGGVNVVLPQLRLDYTELANMIFNSASDSKVRVKNRKFMYNLVSKFRDLANGDYPLAVEVPKEIFPGLTRDDIEAAIQREVEEQLREAEENQAEKRKRRKDTKNQRTKRKKTEQHLEDDDDEDVDDEDLEDEMANDEEDDIGEDEEFNGDVEDEDAAGEVEDAEMDDDIDDEDDADDVDDSFADEDVEEEEEEEEPVPWNSKKQQHLLKNKIGKIARKTLPQFDLDDNWDDGADEDTPKSPGKAALKPAKAGKKSWEQSPLEGEIEIVIPNKKYKGKLQMKPAKDQAQKSDAAKSPMNRKVNFTLEKNKFQEHSEYQESVRKSPGVPHDPQKKPSFGVLKRNSLRSNSAKTKTLKF